MSNTLVIGANEARTLVNLVDKIPEEFMGCMLYSPVEHIFVNYDLAFAIVMEALGSSMRVESNPRLMDAIQSFLSNYKECKAIDFHTHTRESLVRGANPTDLSSKDIETVLRKAEYYKSIGVDYRHMLVTPEVHKLYAVENGVVVEIKRPDVLLDPGDPLNELIEDMHRTYEGVAKDYNLEFIRILEDV